LVWAAEQASYEMKTYTYGAAAALTARERELYDKSGTDYVRYTGQKLKDKVADVTFPTSPEEYMNQLRDKWEFGAVTDTATKTLTNEVVLESSAAPGSACCLDDDESRNVGATQAANAIGWRLPGAADLHAQIEWPKGGGALKVTPAAGQSVVIQHKGGKPVTVADPNVGSFDVGDVVVLGTATVTVRRAKEYKVEFNAMSTKCEVRRRILCSDDPAKPFASRAFIAPMPWGADANFEVA
jgi:hypothetical protein